MAGRYGPTAVTGTLEDSPGGTAQNFEGFLTGGLDGIGHEAETTDTTALGDSFREHTATGIKTHDDITLELIWDTTATTGTHAIFGTVDDGPQDDGRELVIVFGDSKTYTVDVRLVSYKVGAVLDDIQKATAVLRPTGSGAWS